MDKLRNKLSSLVMNSNYIWAYIEPPKWADVSSEDRAQFEKITRKVFDVIQEVSNFETEKAKILSDYLIGTTAFKVKYTQNLFAPAEIEHCPLEFIYLGNDRNGKPGDVFYKKKNVNKYIIADSYGQDVLNHYCLEGLSDDDKIEIYEATILFDNKILYAASKDTGFTEVFYYEEMTYNPWVVARCELLPGSPYGCGPSIKAVMELIALKRKKRNLDKIGAKTADPAYIGYGNPQEIKSSRLNTPGTISIFRNVNTKIVPFQDGFNPEVELFNLQENKEILRDIFYIDFITAIKDVDDLKNVTATATQVAVSKFAEQIEPMYSMIQKELLKGVVMKVFECCKLANLVNVQNIEWLKENPRTSLRYYNAIVIAQDQEDLQNARMFLTEIGTYFGQVAAAASIREKEFMEATARRFRINSSEFYTGEEFLQRLAEMQQQLGQTGQGGGGQ